MSSHQWPGRLGGLPGVIVGRPLTCVASVLAAVVDLAKLEPELLEVAIDVANPEPELLEVAVDVATPEPVLLAGTAVVEGKLDASPLYPAVA